MELTSQSCSLMEDETVPNVAIPEFETLRQSQDYIMTEEPPALSLPWTLRLFFALNGFTLSLEGLGLMYIINSRVEMPIPYLPTYGAIAFLPYSLKPLYGYLSQGRISRYQLFIGLLFGNGVSVFSTCFIPRGGVFLACLVAFVRGVTDSWAELCLGITLIDHVRVYSNIPGYSYEGLASKFQAQAATARNLGSFFAFTITFIIFTGRQSLSSSHTELSAFDANAILISAGGLQVLGAAFAYWCRREFQAPSSDGFVLIQHHEVMQEEQPDEASALREDETNTRTPYSSTEEDSWNSEPTFCPRAESWNSRINGILVVLLQSTILILAMQGPITEISSHLLWKVLVVSFLLATLLVGIATYFNQWCYTSHKVGVYLILKHALPSDSMVLGSFFYFLFQSSPAELQILSLLGSGVTTFSSWSYGRLLSKYNTGSKFLTLIAGTTVLAAIASLGNIVIFRHSQSDHLIWIVVVVKTISTFFEEWEFLPDVVLATTSLNAKDETILGPASVLPTSQTSSLTNVKARNDAVEYGTLISCIDFGDEIGSLVTGPLVALLGISRENNFERLDHLISVCFLFNIMSVGLLLLLRKG